MEVITAYRTEDGKIFDTRSEAQAHEIATRVDDGLRDFWERYGYSPMTASDAAALCIEHSRELRDILIGGSA